MREVKQILKKILNEEYITQVIENLSNDYIEKNVCTLWDINNGYCDEFASSVIKAMGGYKDNLYEISGDMFFANRDPEFAEENWGQIIKTEYGVWSKEMLDYWGYPPADINKVHRELNHIWIFYNGKHYDAEAPAGVEKWYDLPLNKKFFHRFK
jgi:hypothetical protein